MAPWTTQATYPSHISYEPNYAADNKEIQRVIEEMKKRGADYRDIHTFAGAYNVMRRLPPDLRQKVIELLPS